MTNQFEKELEKIVSHFADDKQKANLKESIINLFEKYDSGELNDEVVDNSHISERQTDIFSQGA